MYRGVSRNLHGFLQLLLGIMFSSVVYFMTGQPLEMYRYVGFCAMGLAVAVTSQGLGFAIGSIFNIKNGSVVGPSILAPLLALAVYGMGYRSSIEPFMKFMMSLTYLRYGVVGYSNTLFYNRPPLECPSEEIYCHYARPDVLMKDMGMPAMDYTNQLGMVLLFMVFFRIISYVSLKLRLNTELSSKIVYYANKIVSNHRKH